MTWFDFAEPACQHAGGKPAEGAGTAVVVSRLAYGGDANRDGIVDQADYTAWYNAYGSNAGWDGGDFNQDGMVDQGDYTLWYNAYGTSGSVSLTANGSSVPEPGTIAMMVVGAVAALRRRRT